MSGSEREQVSAYVAESEKQTFKAHAEASDLSSLSKWVVQACREKAEREALADDAQRYRVEQRLLALVDDAAERTADNLADELAPAVAEAVIDTLVARGVVDSAGAAVENGSKHDEPDVLEFGPKEDPELPERGERR